MRLGNVFYEPPDPVAVRLFSYHGHHFPEDGASAEQAVGSAVNPDRDQRTTLAGSVVH
jgi:hypothetical protein